MSSTAVEAKSLSSLTALASNPPAYPRNPTHEKHEPLVLYIARVPGSKDVFLSPMKPREKVVTAEDITSSLYFVHIEHPQDVNLVSHPEFQDSHYPDQRPNAVNRLSAPIIQRKAVPGTAAAAPARKAVPGTLAPIANFDSRQNASAGEFAQRSGMLSPSYEPRGSYDSNRSQTENDIPTIQPRRPEVKSASAGISLTLIRRDPASGAQWNVARIDDPTISEISSTGLIDAARRKPGAPMYIEISNPGYSKFLHSDTDQRIPLSTRTSDLSIRSHQSSNVPPYPSVDYFPESSSRSDCVFRRRLWMEGSHLGGGFGHRKSGSYDRNPSRPTSRGNYDDTSSVDQPLPSPSFLTRDDQAFGALHVSERQSNFRGYVFTSPWNGRCEFITGASGGTLKCRHIIPGLQGAPPAAATVSEMRFNLPSAAPAPSPREETSKRSSFFKRGRHSRNNSSVSANHVDGMEEARSSLDRLDLSLGQEFAGGGFGGKQAKLGKIILEDEGLKMMDLLVATNIGLWWRAYEKAQAAARGDRGSY